MTTSGSKNKSTPFCSFKVPETENVFNFWAQKLHHFADLNLWVQIYTVGHTYILSNSLHHTGIIEEYLIPPVVTKRAQNKKNNFGLNQINKVTFFHHHQQPTTMVIHSWNFVCKLVFYPCTDTENEEPNCERGNFSQVQQKADNGGLLSCSVSWVMLSPLVCPSFSNGELSLFV